MAYAITRLVTIGILAAAPAGAESASKIRVCLDSWVHTHPYVLNRAEFLSSHMFATAGVDVEWRTVGSAACRETDVRTAIVEFSIDEPQTRHPGAMGYAQLDDGVHVTILLDRIEVAFMNPSSASAILAHVMTHEITHLLEGLPRHSETGLMKSHWSAKDLVQMAVAPMPFAPEDVDLIHSGLGRWNSEEGTRLAGNLHRDAFHHRDRRLSANHARQPEAGSFK